ncbi:uncharacterized protein LOC142318971 isoform X2 [Lycorma delicatula]|uniref:uncharacterized protein LOC142318971 isoform X2 n=1 Tax=Lycorma delicatula TaxID=130591 RepID=UPI003F51940C
MLCCRWILRTVARSFSDMSWLACKAYFSLSVCVNRSLVMGGVTLLKVCLEVPFPGNTEAEIVYNTLRVDKEPPRSNVQKVLSVEGNKVIAKFTGPGAKELRTAVNSFMDYLILVIETVKRFGPPTTKQYSYFTP